jgi:hypothetical protein
LTEQGGNEYRRVLTIVVDDCQNTGVGAAMNPATICAHEVLHGTRVRDASGRPISYVDPARSPTLAGEWFAYHATGDGWSYAGLYHTKNDARSGRRVADRVLLMTQPTLFSRFLAVHVANASRSDPKTAIGRLGHLIVGIMLGASLAAVVIVWVTGAPQ